MRAEKRKPFEQRSRIVQLAAIAAALIFTAFFTWNIGDTLSTGRTSIHLKSGRPLTYDKLTDPPGFWGTVIFYGFMTMLSGTMAFIGIWRVTRASRYAKPSKSE